VIEELITHVAIEPEVVKKIVALENSVLLDHPVILFRNERLQDGCGDIGVIAGSERVTDVVQKCADDVFLIPSILVRASGGLQAMLQPVNSEAAAVTVQ
jgi:hypothetical protein